MPVLPSYRNQSIDLVCKSIDWFLYEGSTGIQWVNTVEMLIFHCIYAFNEKLASILLLIFILMLIQFLILVVRMKEFCAQIRSPYHVGLYFLTKQNIY